VHFQVVTIPPSSFGSTESLAEDDGSKALPRQVGQVFLDQFLGARTNAYFWHVIISMDDIRNVDIFTKRFLPGWFVCIAYTHKMQPCDYTYPIVYYQSIVKVGLP